MGKLVSLLLGTGLKGIVILLGILFWILMAMLGFAAYNGGSFQAGVVCLFLTAILVLVAKSKAEGAGRLRRLIFATGVATAVILFLAFTGFLGKDVREAASEYKAGKSEELANALSDGARSSELGSGIFRYDKEGGAVYVLEKTKEGKKKLVPFSQGGKLRPTLKNEMVRVMTLAKGKGMISPSNGPEGMTQVMLVDNNNDFINGPIVWIPNRRLGRWEKGVGEYIESSASKVPKLTKAVSGLVEGDGKCYPVFTLDWGDSTPEPVEFVVPSPGKYRARPAEWFTRKQYTDHLSDGRYRNVFPDGMVQETGGYLDGIEAQPYLIDPLKHPLALLIKGREYYAIQKDWIEFEMTSTRGQLELNVPRETPPTDPVDPKWNFIRNEGSVVRIEVQRCG